jgi:Protein of unknown function (DUF3788)
VGKIMSIGIFTDKNLKPGFVEINKVLGNSKTKWDEITGFVENNFKCKQDFAFYGKNYGWSVRYKKSGGAVISLYPGDGYFTAQVILSSGFYDEVEKLKLHKKVKKILADATPYPEGKWLFIKIETDADIADVKKLLELKVKKK